MAGRWVAAWIVAAGLAVGCSDGGSMATKVVIDGDGAFDDIKAIVYLLEQPDVDVVAITMSGTGVAHCPAAAENVAAMLLRIDAPDIPVSCGRTTPLEGTNAAPASWRSAADTLGGVELPEPPDLGSRTAPELIVEAVEDAGDGVVIVALGPLTNIAEAFEANPDIVDRVGMIYLMGGAVDAGGNVMYANPDAEFNIWADPRAAAIVFATDVAITLIPLDATNDVPVTPFLYEAVDANRTVSPVTEFMAEYLAVTPLYGGMYHWDELAAVVATDETVVTLEERNLAIVEAGGAAAGATIESATGRPVRVAVEADQDAFEARFYEAIVGSADTGVAAWEPDATVKWDGTTCAYAGPDPMVGEVFVEIDNSGSEIVALVIGSYVEGTTSVDYEEYVASGVDGPAPFWNEHMTLPVPVGGREVWRIVSGEGMTAVCFVDPARVFELAGPRILD